MLAVGLTRKETAYEDYQQCDRPLMYVIMPEFH